MKTLTFWLCLAAVTLAATYAEKALLESELEAALEEYISNRGIDLGDLLDNNELDDSLGEDLDGVANQGDDGEGDDSDGDDDDDGGDDGESLRALLTAYRELEINARGTDDVDLTAEEQAMLNDLANLDDDTLSDLMENRELLATDEEVSERSLKAQVAEDLLIRRLLNDHPDLRALAYAEEESEDGSAVLDRRGWFKKAWKKVKNFFKKAAKLFAKVWKKWGKKILNWLKKIGRKFACLYCKSPNLMNGMSWAEFKVLKDRIKKEACKICYN